MLKFITLFAALFTFSSLSFADVNRGSKGTDFKGHVVGEQKMRAEEAQISDFLGKWVSQNVSGGTLLFVVSKIEIDFNKDRDFVATIYFDGGGTEKYTGTYKIVDKYVYLYRNIAKNNKLQKHNKPYKLKYFFLDPEKTLLRLHDENFGVTLMMTRPAGLGTRSGGIFGGL